MTDWASKLAPDHLLRLTLEEVSSAREVGRRPRPRHRLFTRGSRLCRERVSVHLRCTDEDEWTGALSAKLALAADPLFERLRDRIAALAHERLAAEIDSSAWTPTEVATLSRKELSPKTATDMAQLLVDRLDDLQELLLKDTGPRAGWASIDDENTLRPLIARELEVASRESLHLR